MTVLLDSNVIIALMVPEHSHNAPARRWFESSDEPFASCPITEGSLVRDLIRRGDPTSEIPVLLARIAAHPRHTFWPDDIPYSDISFDGIIGHRQVTDAYLAALARHHGGRLASFDRGLAAFYPDVVELVPVEAS